MSYNATVYQVMIAGPSDVRDEKDIARKIIWQWNEVHARTDGIALIPAGWGINTYADTGDRPQEIINGQVLADSDLLIVVFWSRLGTPSGGFESGTVEEIRKHVGAGKHAMLYFCDAPLPQSHDPEQFRRLMDFKKGCEGFALFEGFQDKADFEAKFGGQLHSMVGGLVFHLSLIGSNILEQARMHTDGFFHRVEYNGLFRIQSVDGMRLCETLHDAVPKWVEAFEQLEVLKLVEFVQNQGGGRKLYRLTEKAKQM